MTDEQLIADFEACRLEAFPHRDHVRVAWIYLRQSSFTEAAEKFVSGLRRFAKAAGKPELYHDTITWAFLVLIRERMESGSASYSWDEFAKANGDLLRWKPSMLERYYTAETLFSDRARRMFLLPDRLQPE